MLFRVDTLCRKFSPQSLCYFCPAVQKDCGLVELCFMWIEYVFCFGQMSFRLFEFCDIGKVGDYLVDNVSTENRENIKVSNDSGWRRGE